MLQSAGVQMSLQGGDFISLKYVPSCGTTESYSSSVYNFLRNVHAVSIVAVPIYIPTNSVRGFPSLQTLSIIFCLWIDRKSTRLNSSHAT